jgi:hypothetical protein
MQILERLEFHVGLLYSASQFLEQATAAHAKTYSPSRKQRRQRKANVLDSTNAQRLTRKTIYGMLNLLQA